MHQRVAARSRRIALASFTCAGLVVAALAGVSAAADEDCTPWSGDGSLQQAVDRNDCVEVQAGTYDLPRYLLLADGHTLQGEPGVDRSQIVLRAKAPFNSNGYEGLINGYQPPHDDVATVRHLTLDANGLATGALGASDFEIDDVVAAGGRCWGVAIVGPHVTVRNSRIERNGADPACPSAPGAGIYASANGVPVGRYAPVIEDNEIVDNVGPGLDIYNVWDGTLARNVVRGNDAWAGVSLLGSHWSIRDNVIDQAATWAGQPHVPMCRGGPDGPHAAAILLCQVTIHQGMSTTGNLIAGNALSSYYGVLAIGNDEANPKALPYGNVIQHNTFEGSTLDCADDFRQAGPDVNRWIGCLPIPF